MISKPTLKPSDFFDMDLFQHEPLVHAFDLQYTWYLKLGLKLCFTGTYEIKLIFGRCFGRVEGTKPLRSQKSSSPRLEKHALGFSLNTK